MSHTSKAFLGAYRKGRLAATNKQPRVCPYANHRGGRYCHVPTYSQSFRNFWFEGYDDERAGIPEHYEANCKP